MSNSTNTFNTAANMAAVQALEEALSRIASAAADLDDVSAIIRAAVQCAAQNPDVLNGLSANQADLDAAQSAAHEYGKRLAAIADEAESEIGAYTVTAALCASPEFSAAMWRICQLLGYKVTELEGTLPYTLRTARHFILSGYSGRTIMHVQDDGGPAS